MTKEQYKQLKSEIKDLTTNIRVGKTDRKKQEQDYTKYRELERLHFTHKMTSSEWLDVKKQYPNAYRLMSDARWNVECMSQEFRWRHILLSLERGKSINQIEQKHSKDYWKIKQYIDMQERVKKENETYNVENFETLFRSDSNVL